MHPSLEYLIVACVAAAGSGVLTPLARVVAIRWGAVAVPRDRDVHAVAIPRLGGVALLGGFGLALLLAHRLPTLAESFRDGPNLDWVFASCVLVCALGALDDRYELDWATKLAGQVVAIGVLVTKGGVQLMALYWPFGHGTTVTLGADLAVPLTIVLTLLTINAMNFIDGLDGLAAGVAAISALAFFGFSYHLAIENYEKVTAPSLLVTAALAGLCLGFLPHNFFPARIFMGDSGSMLIGMLLSTAAVMSTTRADPQGYSNLLGTLPLYMPLLIPVAVLAVPFVDLLLAVVRRLGHGRSPLTADKKHLHHRLLEMGHTHRRAVLLLYFWSALLAFGGVAFSILQSVSVLGVMLGALAAVGVVVSVVPRLRRLPAPRPPAPVTTIATAAVSPVNPAPVKPPVAPGPAKPAAAGSLRLPH